LEKSKLNSLITRLVHTDDQQEVKDLYRQWSASYDSDLDSFGYVAPKIGVALFEQVLANKSAHIHDAGCGTGLVGQLLQERGYKNIVGSDFSDDMLRLADKTGCYQSLTQADYTQPLEIPDNTFDGIISIGVYTKRFKQMFLNEMLRTLKPGGCMVFSCRPLYFEEVADSVKGLHVDKSVTTSSFDHQNYMTGQDASAYYVTLKKSRVIEQAF